MNIFILDLQPQQCARDHNDRHVVKMILESCQLLSTAHRVLDGTHYIDSTSGRRIQRWRLPDTSYDSLLYQATHINHPCAVWCRSSLDHYEWLWQLTTALAQEYTFRYGRTHKCHTIGLIESLKTPPLAIPQIGWQSPALAMPDDCKDANCVVAYRSYYKNRKQHLASWTRRVPPAWWIQQ